MKLLCFYTVPWAQLSAVRRGTSRLRREDANAGPSVAHSAHSLGSLLVAWLCARWMPA
jgi:hypothetical protein